MTAKILQTHDLPVRPLGGQKKLAVVTTSDMDEKGKLKPAARERIEGTAEGATHDAGKRGK